jgi:hypothetical protein
MQQRAWGRPTTAAARGLRFGRDYRRQWLHIVTNNHVIDKTQNQWCWTMPEVEAELVGADPTPIWPC